MDETIERWRAELTSHTPRRLEATFSIVTPMFLGDGTQRAESVRPPSIKGALRFWWRALNWGRMREAERGNTDAALQRLHREEARLFGLAARRSNDQQEEGGQGLFRLGVSQPSDMATVSDWPRDGNSQGGYLGYGLWGSREAPHRTALAEDQSFRLSLAFKADTKDGDIHQLRQALTLWGLLGGLGSRARRGFGSVALTELDGEPMAVTSLADYRDRLSAALGDGSWPDSRPPFTAWSQQARCHAFATAPSGRAAIGKLEAPYKEVRKSLRGKTKVVFGLPLVGVDSRRRRASPFLMHVHPVGDAFLPVVTELPADFHPDVTEPEGFGQPLKLYFSQATERLL
ncbi:hypothetical protein FIU83_13045 [Halomonas sp. THAF5a]|uniref:type III-B CRISPR module RAMP protein Cmr1 n=1 Tax=Halomonas sp. THAF5a TaxID=2587844 RepID=UPI0012A881BD|nr:type III-B CRISPR module RAMP protein Cmr1 [Halomonas sp. THAF5a]QFU02563.1 hypothetical protein FIU83_13045 [Halomonas sp. THAF5a]